MQTKKFITIVVAVIALAGVVGGAFFGGMAAGGGGSGGAQTFQIETGMFPGGMRPGDMNGSVTNFDMGIMGTVSNISGNMITLTGFDGSTVQVYTNGSTIFQKTVEGNLSDIKMWQNISVSGQRGQSGSVNATDITIEPSFRMADFLAPQSLP